MLDKWTESGAPGTPLVQRQQFTFLAFDLIRLSGRVRRVVAASRPAARRPCGNRKFALISSLPAANEGRALSAAAGVAAVARGCTTERGQGRVLTRWGPAFVSSSSSRAAAAKPGPRRAGQV